MPNEPVVPPAVPAVPATPAVTPQAAPGATTSPGQAPAATPDIDARLKAIQEAERGLHQQRNSFKSEQEKWKAERADLEKKLAGWEQAKKRAKLDPKGWLEANELTYDEITEAQLAGGPTAGMLAKSVDEIRAEIQAEFDKRDKDRQAELQKAEEDRRSANLQMWHQNTTNKVKSDSAKYPLITALGVEAQVGQEIEAHYNGSGEELTVDKAAEALEARLSDLVEKVLVLEKYKGRLKDMPPPAPKPGEAPASSSLAAAKAADGGQGAPEERRHQLRDGRPMRSTLTNDDTGTTTPINLRGKSPQQAWEELKRSRGLS